MFERLVHEPNITLPPVPGNILVLCRATFFLFYAMDSAPITSLLVNDPKLSTPTYLWVRFYLVLHVILRDFSSVKWARLLLCWIALSVPSDAQLGNLAGVLRARRPLISFFSYLFSSFNPLLVCWGHVPLIIQLRLSSGLRVGTRGITWPRLGLSVFYAVTFYLDAGSPDPFLFSSNGKP